MSIYVQSNQIISELRCQRNLLTSSKAVPLCLKQVLVVKTSLTQISGTRTSFLTILSFLCVIFFIICQFKIITVRLIFILAFAKIMRQHRQQQGENKQLEDQLNAATEGILIIIVMWSKVL